MEPSAVKFQCQTLVVNPNEQINSVSSEVSLLELSLSASLARPCASLCSSASPANMFFESHSAENGNVRGDSQTGKGFNMHASLKTNTTVQ